MTGRLGAFLGVAFGVSFVGTAGTVVDFSQARTNNWRVLMAAPSEMRVDAAGLHVQFDRAKMAKPEAPWAGLYAVERDRPVLTPGKIRVVMRYSEGGIVRTPGSLRVVDAEGEVFRYSPVERTRLDDRMLVTYNVIEGGQIGAFFAGRPKAGSTQGPKRNERFDLPIRLQEIAVGLEGSEKTGELVFERIETDGGDTERTVTARAPLLKFRLGYDRFLGNGVGIRPEEGRLSVHTARCCSQLRYATFPGMKPFPSTCDIILRTSTNATGPAILNLVDPATGAKLRLRSPWRTETHFTTNLPAGSSWQVQSLEFWQAKRKDGTIPEFDFAVTGLEGVWRTSGAGACRLDVETGNELHVVRPGRGRPGYVSGASSLGNVSGASRPASEVEQPVLTLWNTSDAVQKWKGVLRCRDFWGNGFDVPVDQEVAAGKTARIPLKQFLGKGVWYVYGEITAADGSSARPQTRFAVLDDHPRTVRLARGAKFRPGINWHAARFPDGVRALTEDALEACGCKLVRAGGFGQAGIERREGEFDWSIPDAIMAETEARGISLDTIVYGPPRWAQDTNRIARIGHFKAHMVPPREGAFEAFAEKIAARYGTKIDYYELGNEWDLIPEVIMTRDEAVRVHREGYAALKRGCPDVAVMSNGWTSPDVRPDHYGKQWLVGEGYLAYVMSRIKDQSDYFPIHMHCPFSQYRKKVLQFLDLRRRIGCEGTPWFSNETALSSVNGQEASVARDVYRKILYAWANGSTDYIWYNLKATGWVESDPEQGYGLITADFYPRAGYAAFSSLTAIYLGLDYASTLIDRATRLVYRFSGAKTPRLRMRGVSPRTAETDAENQIVLAGWDEAAVTPCAIRVRTDAAQVEQVDLMGNRQAVPVVNGEAVWRISDWPSSLVLTGVARAEPNADDLAAIPVRPGSVVTIPPPAEGRGPDFELKTADRVCDFHQAIPEARHRVWKGPQDLSAKIWFSRQSDDVRVRVEATDDIHTAGDGAEVTLQVPGAEPQTVRFPTAARSGTTGVYELLLRGAEFGFDAARLATGVSFTVKVFDDDGEGPDGWINLTDETEPMKVLRFK